MPDVSFDRRTAAMLVSALAFSLAAAAQSTERPKPPTVPLEDLPPPPPMITTQPEPQVTQRNDADQSVQEYRLKGKLYMMRVTPKNGPPYVLMDLKGDGTFTRQENALDNGVRVPQWVLMEF
jgi:hypothetical protein